MARFAHPGHALSDVEQARVHCLYMECLLLYEDDPRVAEGARFFALLESGGCHDTPPYG